MKKNKHYIKRALLLTMGCLLFSSCNKFLDENPDMRTEINTVDKVAQLLVSAYPGYSYFFTESATDNFEDKGPGQGSHLNQPMIDLYLWKDPDGSGNSTPVQYWNGCYEAIAAANQALESIEEGGFKPEKINQYKGEALVARAYSHFMLVTLFSKAYEINGNNESPGIPYVTKPETIVMGQYERETVAATYAKIEKDLEEGLPLLAGGVWQVPKYHFNPQAAHAFAARFYLFKGDWDKVITHVSAIFPDNNFYDNIRQYAGNLYNLSYAEHSQEYTKAEKPFNLLLANCYSTYHRDSGFGKCLYGFGEQKKNEWAGNTPFGPAFRNRLGSWGAPHYTPNKYKEYFHYSNVAAGIGYPYIMMPLFTTDEALANRAEAYIQKGDYTNAINDLNVIGRSRIVNFNVTSNGLTLDKAKTFTGLEDDKSAMLASLLDIKKKMFLLEGIRWMDILRHKITVKHNLIAADGTETYVELKPEDNHRLFQIPQQATLAGIELNPR
ncbi:MULTISPECIES: RagB/SusD family nutrient uptake outer membrane protein [Sphingobacterium]|uniref:SusD-like starch-binding protein associating with outer membrane n=1 Tax=Sphingobacterium siyangense TaxID=459529 RepID=A0A562M946_9SPHI|nr:MULTISPECIES: RagB/SusD family nutrient uptake outer membrane protein [Sphingobacterium]HAF33398.1 RagB/SusD family nutrient uptake outer membrane protein [Sphingobacterium sp.]TWI16466.1 SusD-like starch-binding protein associating with outer membrane [Sphingobacterium siyangense]HAT91304.1 RagB/SusD family nutrient uptake outer membrane protein [Sphingobacterium sp.]HAU52576.1 RagB/SusD family nutrient uptake outer membrane protein [Sphingobacterium sp.]HCX55018.1 RagB/SusD family nutrien